MLVISGFHKVVSATSICFPVVSVFPGDSCLVHQVVHLAANAREDFTCFRLFFRATGTSVGLGCCSIVVVIVVVIVAIQELIIVSGDLSLHIVHTPVT